MSTDKNRFPPTRKETSSFAKTCNRLSSFLKEKGSFKDLKIDEKFDAKGKQDISSEVPEKNIETVDLLSNMETTVQMSINNIPEYVTLDSFCEQKDSINKAAQMTIFYGGQVIVLNSISADKARELMLAARSASSSFDDQINQIRNQVQPASASASASISPCEAFESQVVGSDLPIVRRASLHRFLAKRKDRATVRAPYQLQNPLLAAEPLTHKFDLNL